MRNSFCLLHPHLKNTRLALYQSGEKEIKERMQKITALENGLEHAWLLALLEKTDVIHPDRFPTHS